MSSICQQSPSCGRPATSATSAHHFVTPTSSVARADGAQNRRGTGREGDDAQRLVRDVALRGFVALQDARAFLRQLAREMPGAQEFFTPRSCESRRDDFALVLTCWKRASIKTV